MDEIAVPGILAYKGGDCFANMVSIVNEIPSGKEFSASVLELMLQQYVLATDHGPSGTYADISQVQGSMMIFLWPPLVPAHGVYGVRFILSLSNTTNKGHSNVQSHEEFMLVGLTGSATLAC